MIKRTPYAQPKPHRPPNQGGLIKECAGIYTREHALKHGILVDVSAVAKRLNYPGPVALSHLLFEQCVQWRRQDSDCQCFQDQALRLSNLLIVAKAAAQITGRTVTETEFTLNVRVRDGFSVKKTPKQLKISVSHEASDAPVFTITRANDVYQALVAFSQIPHASWLGGYDD